MASKDGITEADTSITTKKSPSAKQRKQMQDLSIDIETKIINDMDERIHGAYGGLICVKNGES